MKKVVITKLEQISPSQWEGLTNKGEWIGIRIEGTSLIAEVAPNKYHWVYDLEDYEIFVFPTLQGGYMGKYKMLKLISSVIDYLPSK